MSPPDRKLTGPLAERGEAADREPTVRQSRAKPGVLVVDDEHFVRAMVQLSLEQDGFDVWLACSGREAIHLYQKHQDSIDVVLLDVCMRGLDGPETLEALRALNPEVLACFMSGGTGAYRPEELRRRGAAHVIAKPFRLDQLANTLQLLVNGAPAEYLPSAGSQG